ncbi:hypothetical protein [Chitinophaga tropicalis]|uniref:Uncharacterized protein n=1 Tax=Chitinophaga tropicalis TaxID=2683588 RepID=A0A7K1TYU9_9BACT|nr:hypothetical protein [Chitinophaga tropicalis]MVT07220.1 hypothetical protein [Chitinophaga tropicalis]
MKHIQFIPKQVGIVLAAILFLNISFAKAQAYTYAYNKINTPHHEEEPVTVNAFKLDVAQIGEGDALIFKVTIENPGSEKITLSIKDGNNYTLHQETVPATLVYKAKFNMQELQDGNYIFEIRKGKTRLAEKKIDIRTETSINRTVSVQ